MNAFPGLEFDKPLCLRTPGGESNRLFVVEQTGRIFLVNGIASSFPEKSLFLDLKALVDRRRDEFLSFNAQGTLVGFELHPGFSTNGVFFVFYTPLIKGSQYNRLSRFTVSNANPNVADPDSEQPLIQQLDQWYDHNSGTMHFGPNDGYLYVSLGDEGSPNDTFKNSQRIDNDFFSGMIRIDVDNRPESRLPNDHPAIVTHDGRAVSKGGIPFYKVPADNPWAGPGSFVFNGIALDPDDNDGPANDGFGAVRTEFWAVGLRNPWGWEFDPQTGVVILADVGENRREEINIIKRGGNYGWNYFEGSYSGTNIPDGVITELPVYEYSHGPGPLQGLSVTGGIVYHANGIPRLRGRYIFADFVSGNVWSMNQWDSASVERLFIDIGIAAFAYDPSNGEVLYADLEEGRVKRVVETTIGSDFPDKLSRTGVFSDLNRLTPNSKLVPFEPNVSFWSDYAQKRRWVSLNESNQPTTFDPEGSWRFPIGMFWVKHFDLEITNGVPGASRRLETRFLIRKGSGVSGVTYRWNETQTDADLVEDEGRNESIAVYTSDGTLLRNQNWRYPSRNECLQCHTAQGGFALGFSTAQLNRDHDYGDGATNQITHLAHLDFFDGPVPSPEKLLRLTQATDTNAPLESRVRSYLQANCAQCHHPGGTALGFWDARFASPFATTGILNGPLVNNLGDETNRVIRPGSLDHSMMYRRLSDMGPGHMPPIGTSERNEEALSLMREWITSLIGSLDFTVDEDGYIYFTCEGVPGRTYRVEASTDMLTWMSIGTVRTPASGVVKFIEPATEEIGARFYRLVWP